MKARVVRSRCIGAGDCVRVAPAVFRLDFDAKRIAGYAKLSALLFRA